MPTVRTGGCACGAVRFTVRGVPIRAGLCHCMTCRKHHAAPFHFFAIFPEASVEITGERGVFASSERGRRSFCRACGAPVSGHWGEEGEIELYPSSFDETDLLAPTYEAFVGRRESWLPPIPTVIACYAENRTGTDPHEGGPVSAKGERLTPPRS